MRAVENKRLFYIKIVRKDKNGGKPFFMLMRRIDGLGVKGIRYEFEGIMKDRGINCEVKTVMTDIDFARNVYERKTKDAMEEWERDRLMNEILKEMTRFNTGIDWARHNIDEKTLFTLLVNEYYSERQERNGLNVV